MSSCGSWFMFDIISRNITSCSTAPAVASVDLAFQQSSYLKGKNGCNWREREHVQPCASVASTGAVSTSAEAVAASAEAVTACAEAAAAASAEAVIDNWDPALFSMAAWAIWNQRNNLRLEKPAVSLGELLSQSKERMHEFKLYNSSITPMGRPPTSWQAPDRNTYKVNFDGVLFTTENSAGLGVVIRNEEG
ncbi:hypothetical protein SO802_020564 [Lithocarpus litseifolius]|uniref:RNase H type-1 domain-containing protein n=1 Tax=Lithocarpus litseifolius TaxID=425828 RepID=A0AAW2CDY4_9ROSI